MEGHSSKRTSGRSRQPGNVQDSSWDCSVCTYKNSAELFKCDMCDTRKGTSTREVVVSSATANGNSMSEPLTKSYVNTHDPEHPVQEDLVLYQLFEKARKEGNDGEFVSLETMERMTASQIYDKADEYAKGLLALGLTPGKDTLTVAGIPTLEAVCLFAAATSIGIEYAHPYIYIPMEQTISRILPLVESKVLVVGEGAYGEIFTALLNVLGCNQETPDFTLLPDVKHIFYDNLYKDRSPTQKFINNLDKLRQYGESISDRQLEEARKSVKPEFVMHYLFSSGSTGKPKCIAHTHYGLANELLQLRENNLGAFLTLNPNMDEMVSYSCISWLLAGKIKKVVFTPEKVAIIGGEDFGQRCADSLIPENIEYMTLLPVQAYDIVTALKKLKIPSPPMKLFHMGAQIISRQCKEDYKEIFQGKPFTTYGMTETLLIARTNLGDKASDLELMLDARLYPKLNIELRLVDENNEVVDIGKDGEVQIKSYSIFKHYKGEQDKTRAAFTDDGFFKTGDIATMYPDGTFIIKGRTADAIRFKVLGDVLYPGPIEQVVSKYPGVQDVSVVGGRRSDAIGDELTYCISLHEGVSQPCEEDILTYCAENGLNETQRAARIIYFERLPTTANSRKVSKAILRQKVNEMIAKDSCVGMTQWLQKI